MSSQPVQVASTARPNGYRSTRPPGALLFVPRSRDDAELRRPLPLAAPLDDFDDVPTLDRDGRPATHHLSPTRGSAVPTALPARSKRLEAVLIAVGLLMTFAVSALTMRLLAG